LPSDYIRAKSERNPTVSNIANSGKALPAANGSADEEALVTSTSHDLSKDLQQVADIVRKLQEDIQHTRREIKLEVNEELGRSIVSVLDKDTNEVIRQFPPEEFVSLQERVA